MRSVQNELGLFFILMEKILIFGCEENFRDIYKKTEYWIWTLKRINDIIRLKYKMWALLSLYFMNRGGEVEMSIKVQSGAIPHFV